jgi:inorganic phosphate transporter, PiT family
MSPALILLCATLIAGLYMAWTIGANDVANAMGTSVGSGALTLGGAIIVAGIMEFSGAVLMGSGVTDTISKGIIETTRFAATGPLGEDGPLLLALAMFAALLAAAAWLHLATHFGLPVSTTHSIVGAVLGVGIVSFGWRGVDWGTMLRIVSSWVVSPVLGGLLAFLAFLYIRQAILRAPDPIEATRRSAPLIVAVVVAVMMLSFIYKVLRNRIDAPPGLMAAIAAIVVGTVAGLLTRAFVRRRKPEPGANPYAFVERVFALLQIATACFVAFAHGANDVANAIGPLAAVVTLYRTGFDTVVSQVDVPTWVLVTGGAGIVLGLATLGHKVIATVGKQITEITPTRGFCAEFGAATTVLVASTIGLPISTTHTLVGGVVGVGFAQGIAALNVRVIRNIVSSWIATVPAAAGTAAVLFILLRSILT